ncbi:DinB family protein [Streptomyces sp. P9(2023)]|uniref:DinB family protein n=1 Tax=Streptomyces sp. P9(2023) TaxID=3064394 RepID=UPI0028F40551|nr:DinB family protein [Streptomyces sp. P9(2023)]MDT9692995.1 DinB family protein [Streptomyces sp. P9(2023)]
MSRRGTELMERAGRQLSEVKELFATLSEDDLLQPCTGGQAGDTVGALAAHIAEGYHRLGRLLPDTAHAHAAGHTRPERPAPMTVPDLIRRLADAEVPISRLADLTADQLDSMTPPIPHISDASRTLGQVVEEVIAHQAGHLATLRQAVA